MKGEADAQHARLLAPVRDAFARVGCAHVEATHDGELVRMRFDGGNGEIVALPLPARRHDDGAVNTGGLHVIQQMLLRIGQRTVRCMTRRPRPLRGAGGPNVDLRIDDQHEEYLPEFIS